MATGSSRRCVVTLPAGRPAEGQRPANDPCLYIIRGSLLSDPGALTLAEYNKNPAAAGRQRASAQRDTGEGGYLPEGNSRRLQQRISFQRKLAEYHLQYTAPYTDSSNRGSGI